MTQHSMSSFTAFGVAILIWPLGTEAASFTSASASASIDRPELTQPCAFSETNTDGLAASAAVACEGIGNVGSSAYASSQAAASGVFIPGFESTLTVSTNDQTIYAYSDSKTSATAGVSATIVVLGGIGQGTLSLLFDMSGAAAVTDFGFNPVAATSTQLSVIASTTLPSVLTFCHLPFFSGTVSLTCSGPVNPPPVPFTFGLPFSLTVRLTTDSETQVAIAGPVSNLLKTSVSTQLTQASVLGADQAPVPGATIQVIEPIPIDIKPGTFPNEINPASHGKIPVAILSSTTFNAVTSVNTASLTFGRTGTEQSLAFCNSRGEDVNGDGLLDLVCHFLTQNTGFQPGDLTGVLQGRSFDGSSLQGTDSVVIKPRR